MNIVKLTKIIGLSTVTSQVCLFADTYKLEVAKEGTLFDSKVHFRAMNLTAGEEMTDAFSVTNDVNYDNSDCSVGNVITGLTARGSLLFKVGTFGVSYDCNDERIRLSEGSFKDTLIIEKCDFPIAVEQAQYLKANTLILKGVDTFTNNGALSAYVTVLQDCNTVENRFSFRSRNLFLINTRIKNFGDVVCNDARQDVDGGIERMQVRNRSVSVSTEFATGNTACFSNLPKGVVKQPAGWFDYLFCRCCKRRKGKLCFVNPCVWNTSYTLISVDATGADVSEAKAVLSSETNVVEGNVILKSKGVSVTRYEVLHCGNSFVFRNGDNNTKHYLIADNPYENQSNGMYNTYNPMYFGFGAQNMQNIQNNNQNGQNNNADVNAPNNRNNQSNNQNNQNN